MCIVYYLLSLIEFEKFRQPVWPIYPTSLKTIFLRQSDQKTVMSKHCITLLGDFTHTLTTIREYKQLVLNDVNHSFGNIRKKDCFLTETI